LLPTCNGDESDELRFFSGDEFVAEASQAPIVARGNHGTDNKELRNPFETTTDEAFATPLAGLAGPGREPN
jgi:hypothetical protein